jgi:hypothetical protein
VLASRLAAEPGWRGWATWLRGTAILMMALLAAFGFAMATPHGPAGLFEKAATVVVTIAGTVLLMRVLARAGRLRRTLPVPHGAAGADNRSEPARLGWLDGGDQH